MKKLILFDIDGTLLSTGGAARRAFSEAMLEVYGTTGPVATHPFNGKTDPQIARELLRLAGREDAEIDSGLAALWVSYIDRLERELAKPDQVTKVYPGVHALLDALAARADHIVLGLLTGNILPGAQAKLGSAGLDRYFELGAFGSDCERRDGLPTVAVERAFSQRGRRFEGRDIVVIGDTPHDVTCGRSLGVFALAVATGGHSREELLAAGAHATFEDLSDTDALLELLL